MSWELRAVKQHLQQDQHGDVDREGVDCGGHGSSGRSGEIGPAGTLPPQQQRSVEHLADTGERVRRLARCRQQRGIAVPPPFESTERKQLQVKWRSH